MKKEIDAIRAKDIAQGGLTQGQQTQIARNEQRMSQVYDKYKCLRQRCLLPSPCLCIPLIYLSYTFFLWWKVEDAVSPSLAILSF